MSVTLVWRTDVHLADQPPASRTDDWCQTILDKLIQVGEIAREVGAQAVLDGGDFFHVKSPARNSHRMLQLVAEVHSRYPCPVYANIGNHDVKYGDWEFLPEAPLGVLFATGVFRRCYDQYETVLENAGVKVRVVGIPYHGTTYDLNRFRQLKRGEADHLVVMAHLLASAKGGTMFEAEDIVRYTDIPGLCPEASVVAFGHWHKDQGVTEVAPSMHVVNIGSLSRGSLAQDDVERTPSVAVLRLGVSGKVSIEKRPLQVSAAGDVFDLQGRVRTEVRSMAMETFVSSFKSALAGSTLKPLEDVVREATGILPEVRERALHYLEQART